MAQLHRFAEMVDDVELDATKRKRLAQSTYPSPEKHVIDADAADRATMSRPSIDPSPRDTARVFSISL